MTPEELERLATGLVLGTLDERERADTLALKARDPSLKRAVQRLQTMLAPLDTTLGQEAPPPGTFEGIEAHIEAAKAPLPGTTTLRAGSYDWQPLSQGVDMAVLWQNEKAKRQSLLIRMQPGAHYESHEHDDDEECLVIEGDLAFGDVLLKAGDFHFAPAGRPHPAAYSPSGCLLFITSALD